MLEDTIRFFGLDEDCFQLNFDLKYFYESIQHKEAYVRMKYSIESKYPFYLLSGYPGSGKTIITQLLNLQLTNQKAGKMKYKPIYIGNSPENFNTLMKMILSQFTGKKVRVADEYMLYTRIKEQLEKLNEDNTYVVIFLDEAHNYTKEALEYIRQIINILQVKINYMTICLIGQPELHDNIIRLPQLDKRIQIKYLLSPLDAATTEDYIYFRLSKAGNVLKLFTASALEYIYVASNGIPREINNCCNACFDSAMLKLSRKINKELAENALEDLLQKKTDKEDNFDVSIFKR